MMSPLTLPATIIEAALICAVMTAVSPIVRLSLPVISPSTWPSIRVAPSNDSLPLIFEPLSRYARASGAGVEAFGIGMIGFSLGPGLEVTTTGVIGCAGGRTLEFGSVLTVLSGSLENSAIVYQLLAGNLAQAWSGRTHPPTAPRFTLSLLTDTTSGVKFHPFCQRIFSALIYQDYFSSC